MGVTGLWTIVQPCARPTNISTLNRKRLAVDASIWIYQFLKAVRDKEGNALRNSHVVGFFRRICKLLFFGIKPVFVFDGGAPALKRATIAARKKRREGRREDAVRTAGKLLAVQMQRAAEEEEQKRKEDAGRSRRQEEEEVLPENLVYADEIAMTPAERQKNRTFKKKDQYHLPELDVSLAEMGAPNDPRIMSLEELEQYARQFDTGEDINVYDFSKIDFDSAFFTSLPASDRYNILNAARLRSRLRMGLSKEQLDKMFPNRMDFSRFQIDRVRERNELTQRLMNINSGDDWANTGGRVAGEKGREYVLVKNDGVEGGWALGVVEPGTRSKPIDIEKKVQIEKEEDDEEEDESDDGFEDVPIEGLNRLPKKSEAQVRQEEAAKKMTEQRRAFYARRRAAGGVQQRRPKPRANQDSLFVTDEPEQEEEWEEVPMDLGDDLFEDPDHGRPYDEVAELQRAIAMSLETGKESPKADAAVEPEPVVDDLDDDYLEVFQARQKRVEEAKPFHKGSALAIARMANSRSNKAIAPVDSDSDADDLDLQAALLESRRGKHKARTPSPKPQAKPATPLLPSPAKPDAAQVSKPKLGGLFSGPLPFEKLDLGSSLLGRKKKVEKPEEAGGFEKPENKKAATPPPWFSGDIREDVANQKAQEEEQRRKDREHDERFTFVSAPTLRHEETTVIIDLDAGESQVKTGEKEIIQIASDDEEGMEDVVQDPVLRMGDAADMIRAEPPIPPQGPTENGVVRTADPPKSPQQDKPEEDEPLDWEESDHEQPVPEATSKLRTTIEPAGGSRQPPISSMFQDDSEEDDFEDVPMGNNITADEPHVRPVAPLSPERPKEVPVPASGLADQDLPLEDNVEPEVEEIYSDPEDEDLFKNLAIEAEEHARFASTFNHKTTTENTIDFDRELKQLRNQQRADRRDADEVTQTMIAECQQLLSLFGLPYITAPMEAEAQCAELVQLGLVDGIVTDDSDIFLFGGTRVYKNMFNQAKFVECYLTSDLNSEFNLTREKLIAAAQLLGSDYTEGLTGVGPVTALEIISEFGSLEGFKDWWTSVQNGSRPKAADQDNPFRRKFRKNVTKLFLPPSFPDPRVTEAYLKPEVDSDTSNFVWGVPDLAALRSFLMATIGWSQERTDEVLVPVIRDMNRRIDEGTQSNITNFFSGAVGAGAFDQRVRKQGQSSRMEKALSRMATRERESMGEGDGEELNNNGTADGSFGANTSTAHAPSKNAKTRKRTKQATPVEAGEDGEDEEYAEPRKKTRKTGKGRNRAIAE